MRLLKEKPAGFDPDGFFAYTAPNIIIILPIKSFFHTLIFQHFLVLIPFLAANFFDRCPNTHKGKYWVRWWSVLQNSKLPSDIEQQNYSSSEIGV
jgi:hypothetical protein